MSANFFTEGVLFTPKAARLSRLLGSTSACPAFLPDFGFLSSSSLALAAAARAGGLNSTGLAEEEAPQPMRAYYHGARRAVSPTNMRAQSSGPGSLSRRSSRQEAEASTLAATAARCGGLPPEGGAALRPARGARPNGSTSCPARAPPSGSSCRGRCRRRSGRRARRSV